MGEIFIGPVSVKVEECGGYFSATTDPFAITVYGNNADEAEKRAWEAIPLLLQQHSKTPSDLKTYLDTLKVHYFVRPKARVEDECRLVRECRKEQMAVGV